MKVVLAAGGTGGHVVPALAVAEAVKRLYPQSELTFVGVGSASEQKLIDPLGYRREVVRFSKFVGAGVVERLRLLLNLPFAIHGSRRLLRSLSAEVVVGFGGFPSVLPILAAWSLGIPTVIHDTNQQIGSANRLLFHLARRAIAVPGAQGFPDSQKLLRLPIPVRAEFYGVPDLSEKDGQPKLLVLGGSQGARTINKAIIELLPYLKERGVYLLHQTGASEFESVKRAYAEAQFANAEIFPFVERVSKLCDVATVAVSRAGAMTTAELSAAGLPVIYVPLAISNAHQGENVKPLLAKGAAIVVEQGPKLVEELRAALDRLLTDRQLANQMGAGARNISSAAGGDPAEIIAKEVAALVRPSTD